MKVSQTYSSSELKFTSYSKPTSSINCEFIDYCSNKDFSQFKCPYVFIPVEGEIFLIQLKLKCSLIFTPFCLSAEQNRTNCVDFVWLVIELTEKYQFGYVWSPKKSNNNPTNLVWLSWTDFWFADFFFPFLAFCAFPTAEPGPRLAYLDVPYRGKSRKYNHCDLHYWNLYQMTTLGCALV